MIRPPNALGGGGTMGTGHEQAMPLLKTDATYDDLVELPDHLVAEIVDGRLHASPRPAIPHTNSASLLGAILIPAFHQRMGGLRGWWLLNEPELHLSGDVLVPDIGGWRLERMPKLPTTAAFSVAPDWVCEVASPSTERFDRVEKLPVYAREGVAHVWLVNPLQRTLEVFRRHGPNWTLVVAHGGGGLIRVEPFDALEWDLGSLWDDAEQSSNSPVVG
jgi:Uma2 family endonuclease